MSANTAPTASAAPRRSPVTADDVDLAVHLALATLRTAPTAPAAWEARAGTLEWTCWETVEHLGDDLFYYAAQIGTGASDQDGSVPFRWESDRAGGPENLVKADRAAGTAGLLRVLEAAAVMLSAVVRTAPSTARGHHVFGLSDPEGFAAMGVVETLVHLHDLSEGLSLTWTAPEDLCRRVLDRLFPDAPAGTEADAWATLLWATGRGELEGRERLGKWRWDGRMRDELM